MWFRSATASALFASAVDVVYFWVSSASSPGSQSANNGETVIPFARLPGTGSPAASRSTSIVARATSTSPLPASSRTDLDPPPNMALLAAQTARASGSPFQLCSISSACCSFSARTWAEEVASGPASRAATSLEIQRRRRGSRLLATKRSASAHTPTESGGALPSAFSTTPPSFPHSPAASSAGHSIPARTSPATTSAAAHCCSRSELFSAIGVSCSSTGPTPAEPTAPSSASTTSMVSLLKESASGAAEVRGHSQRREQALWTAAEASGMPAAAVLLISARSSPLRRWSCATFSSTPFSHPSCAITSLAAAANSAPAGLGRAAAPAGLFHPAHVGSTHGPVCVPSRGASKVSGVSSALSPISVSPISVSPPPSTSMSPRPLATLSLSLRSGRTARQSWRRGRRSLLSPSMNCFAVAFSRLLSLRTWRERAAAARTAKRQCTPPPPSDMPSLIVSRSLLISPRCVSCARCARCASRCSPAANSACTSLPAIAWTTSGSWASAWGWASPPKGTGW
mmetsp:Transcript_39346/g.93062  ORF Transcript_39346/g.93062 Transcript_39346/m.93062 type:complete len:514 (+) Transcript_39346:1916-3457(+)